MKPIRLFLALIFLYFAPLAFSSCGKCPEFKQIVDLGYVSCDGSCFKQDSGPLIVTGPFSLFLGYSSETIEYANASAFGGDLYARSPCSELEYVNSINGQTLQGSFDRPIEYDGRIIDTTENILDIEVVGIKLTTWPAEGYTPVSNPAPSRVEVEFDSIFMSKVNFQLDSIYILKIIGTTTDDLNLSRQVKLFFTD